MSNERNFIKSIILFVVGFCLYCTIEVLFRGFSYPLMGAVGGISVIILDKINDEISWDLDLIYQSMIGSVIITSLEFIIGEIALRTDLFPVMWDYSSIPLNFDGVICAPFILAWMGLSVLAIWVADAINYYVFEDTDIPYYWICGKWKITFKEKECNLGEK